MAAKAKAGPRVAARETPSAMTVEETRAQEVIRLENVCKTYKMGEQEVHAVEGVSIAFREGSFSAVMGPSGSGKSTILNLLGCLDRPTSGRYLIANQDVSTLNDDQLSDVRLKYLGFVFQSFNLIPQLTVLENIALPLFYLGWHA